MSNQRPAKTHKAAMGQEGKISLSEVIEFFDVASNLLDRHGYGDSAFWFEQVHEHLVREPHKGLKGDIGRILGI